MGAESEVMRLGPEWWGLCNAADRNGGVRNRPRWTETIPLFTVSREYQSVREYAFGMPKMS